MLKYPESKIQLVALEVPLMHGDRTHLTLSHMYITRRRSKTYSKQAKR
jgi:hypothetical protein